MTMYIEKTIEIVTSVYTWATEHIVKLVTSEEFLFYAAVFVLIGIWVGFALWGARTAAQAKRSALGHLLLSLVMPVIYPAVLPGLIRKQRRKEWEQAKQEEEERRGRKISISEEKKRRGIGKQADRQVPEEDDNIYGSGEVSAYAAPVSPEQTPGTSDEENKQVLFRQMLKEQKEDRQTQVLRIYYADNEIITDQLLEVMPRLLVVQTRSHDKEKKAQSLRIPLNRITRVERQESDGTWREIKPDQVT